MKYLIIFILLISYSFCEINLACIYDDDDEIENIVRISFEFAIEWAQEQRKNKSNSLNGIIKKVPVNNPFQTYRTTCSFLEQGIFAVFGPLNQNNFDAIESVCDSKDIPVLQTRWNYRPLRHSVVINNYPHPKILSKVFLEIVKLWSWKSFVIFYQDNESLHRLEDLVQLSMDETYQVMIRKLTSSSRDVFKEIIEYDVTNFIIDCDTACLKLILSHAQQVGLMNRRYNYLITNLDFHSLDLSSIMYSQTNITSVRIFNPNDDRLQRIKHILCERFYKKVSELLVRANNINCELRTRGVLMIDAVVMLAHALDQMENISMFQIKELSCDRPESWTHGSSLINFIKTKPFYGFTGLNVFDNEGYRSDFNLEITELQETGMVQIGSWNSTEGIKISRIEKDKNLYSNENLQNKNLTVQICLTEPFGFNKESPIPLFGNDRFEGFAIDLIQALAEMEKFNYTLILRDDKDNGAEDPITGTWSGMVGDLLNNISDLAIADLTINSQRTKAVDFTAPFMHLGIAILFRKPEEAPANFFSFADPFAIGTWISLALAFLVSSLSLYVMGRICPSEWTNPYPCIEEPEFLVTQFSLPNCFWFCTGSLMQQGTEIAPIAFATRMVAGMWWFLTLILIASYTANLAAFLATENPVKLFTDVNTLIENAERYGIRYGAKAKGATFNFFKSSKDHPLYSAIYDNMLNYKENMVSENKDGVKKALNKEQKYAFFMESSSIEYETERFCELEMYGDLLDTKGYGIAMRKGTPYRLRLSTSILKLQSTGVIDNLKRKWWKDKKGGGQCLEKDSAQQEATALDMKNVEGVFFVSMSGLIIGIFIVFCENIIYIFNTSRRLKISFFRVFKHEVKFYFNFDSNVKPAHIESREMDM